MEIDKLFSSRALSLESVVSQSEHRPLSPDSPVPLFKPPHISCDVELSRQRSFTPESLASDWEDRSLCLETLFDQTRPDSPQSLSDMEIDQLFSSRALSPEFVSSDLDFSLIQTWLSDFRVSSPESVASVEHYCWSPHISFSQINNQHCNYYLEYPKSTPMSPISPISDVEYSPYYVEELFDENRPDSPDSLTLQDETVSLNTTLTASLPLCTIRPFTYAEVVRGYTHENQPCVLGDRLFELRPACLPSLSSDKEYIESFIDHPLEDLRPQSPESVVSQSEHRPLSPDSPVPQFKPPHISCDVELSRQRSFTPESLASDWDDRSLCLETLFDQTRPDSPQSVLSDMEIDKLFSSRALSPESVVSQSEHRPLSPDSPVPLFKPPHISCDVELSRQRSFTPESLASDWEDRSLCLETLFDQTRPDSPQSLSDMEIDKLFSSRALSPESVSSDLDFSLIQTWLSDFRVSSPESVASVEHYCWSPHISFSQINNQHCNYYLEYPKSTPMSPISTISDVEYSPYYVEELFDENRPDSPDSLTLQDETVSLNTTLTASLPLSTGRPFTYAEVVRGYTHENQPCVLGDRLFELRPACLPSLSSDKEYIESFIDHSLEDLRPQSPESVVSQSEHRPLSPDSPIPQFKPPHISCDVELSRQRSFTPESLASDWEDRSLCLETLFDQTRPDSPQSLSDMEIDQLFSSRALSPESVSSDLDFSLIQTWLSDFRVSSPESVASVEHYCWSPHISFSQINNQHCNYYLEYPKSTPMSPISTISDVEYSPYYVEELCDENRPDSPDSLTLQDETVSLNTTLIASLPLCTGRPFTYAEVVRGYTHENQPCVLGDRLFELRPACLPSLSSDKEYIESFIDHSLEDLRPQSPESVVSQSEHRPLSPDSPVPQFKPPHISCDVELSRQRSFTPESLASDWEDRSLCLETLFDQTRPDSPQSVLSDMEIDKLFSSRALSPESVSSDLDFSLLQTWLSDFRVSSPESVASVEHYCWSPHISFSQINNQHCNYYLEYPKSTPMSPISTISDVEYSPYYVEELFDENRPDSPDSLTLQDETVSLNTTLTASLLLCTGRPFSYAEVVRGYTHENQPCVLGDRLFELRPACLPSLSSDKEYIESFIDHSLEDLRPHLQSQWYLKVNIGPSLLTHLSLSSNLLISVVMWNYQGRGHLHQNH
uniref:uncharacterized protein LOC122770766 isoform X1 n=1 Tax=Solea senegalensis TaxID=28829 RepID=UPI001CD852C9|nr:uncharacterized protein LOC122770766 isoform X1 [Solea senegalensis]